MKRVLMTDELFEQLGASRVDWGQPDADGFYTPSVYKDARSAEGVLARVLDWLDEYYAEVEVYTGGERGMVQLDHGHAEYEARMDVAAAVREWFVAVRRA